MPNADGLVAAAAGEGGAIGGDRDGVDPPAMAGQGFEMVTGGEIPELHGLIFAAADQKATVLTDGEGKDGIFVFAEGTNGFVEGQPPFMV